MPLFGGKDKDKGKKKEEDKKKAVPRPGTMLQNRDHKIAGTMLHNRDKTTAVSPAPAVQKPAPSAPRKPGKSTKASSSTPQTKPSEKQSAAAAKPAEKSTPKRPEPSKKVASAPKPVQASKKTERPMSSSKKATSYKAEASSSKAIKAEMNAKPMSMFTTGGSSFKSAWSSATSQPKTEVQKAAMNSVAVKTTIPKSIAKIANETPLKIEASAKPDAKLMKGAKSIFTETKDIKMSKKFEKFELLSKKEQVEVEIWALYYLKHSGACPGGWDWHRVPGGYRCETLCHGVTWGLIFEGCGGMLFDEGVALALHMNRGIFVSRLVGPFYPTPLGYFTADGLLELARWGEVLINVAFPGLYNIWAGDFWGGFYGR